MGHQVILNNHTTVSLNGPDFTTLDDVICWTSKWIFPQVRDLLTDRWHLSGLRSEKDPTNASGLLGTNHKGVHIYTVSFHPEEAFNSQIRFRYQKKSPHIFNGAAAGDPMREVVIDTYRFFQSRGNIARFTDGAGKEINLDPKIAYYYDLPT